MATLQSEATLAKETELGQSQSLHHVIELDHRTIKRIVKPMLGLKAFNRARRTLSGIEAMNLIRKGQVKGSDQGDSVSQAKLMEASFGMAASGDANITDRLSLKSFCDTTGVVRHQVRLMKVDRLPCLESIHL